MVKKIKPKNSKDSGQFLLENYKLDPKEMKDAKGRYRTRSLFKGRGQSDSLSPVFTLEDFHEESLPSFKRLYVDICDPSEYNVAMFLLGSWEHWTKLIECSWFKPIIKECREELDAKIRSLAVAQIVTDGKGAFSEATRLAANKFLATGQYLQGVEKDIPKNISKRGRPSSLEVERRMQEILTEEADLNSDYSRILLLSDTPAGMEGTSDKNTH